MSGPWLPSEAEPDPGPLDEWSPRSDADVEWAGRRMGELVAEVLEVRAAGAEYRGRIDAWVVQRTADAMAALARLKVETERWALERRAVRGVKSVVLPSVRVTTREETRGRLEVTDAAALEAWCAGNLVSALRTKVTVDVAALRAGCGVLDDGRLVGPGGDVVPGARVVGRGDVSASVTLPDQPLKELLP